MYVWNAGLIALLLAKASALPQHPVAVLATPATLDDKKGECSFAFRNRAESASTWEKSGAGKFLEDLLKEKGFKGWSKHFFEDNVGDDEIKGATDLCMDIQSGSCTPASKECDYYKPPVALLIHQSIHTLWSQFHKLYSELIGEELQNSLSEIKRITQKFGPKATNISSLLTMLIGTFVMGAALAGPLWQLGAPMTAVLGLLNIVSGSLHNLTPQQVNDDLEATAGEFFNALNATMADTVYTFFGGADKIQGLDSDPIPFVLGTFDKGKMLDSYQALEDTKALWDAARKAMKLTLISQAMDSSGHYVSQRTDLSKEDCDKDYPKASWIYNHCTQIATRDKLAGTRFDSTQPIYEIHAINDERYDEIKDLFNYDDILKNAVDCTIAGGGTPGKPQIPLQPPAFGGSYSLPKCFFNLKVRAEDFTGYEGGSPTRVNDNGYTSGWCGVHINQKKPTTDDYVYEFEITLMDATGKEVASIPMSKSDPYVVVEGKESNKDMKLPYNFYAAGGVEPGDLDDVFSPIHFWYGGMYWNSNQGGERGCHFSPKYEKNDIRSGDCGFTCNDPTENPPASATVAHPLPTGVGYAKGWCTVHIKQVRIGFPSGYWKISADVYDNDHHWVGWKKDEEIKYGENVIIKGGLPNHLEVIPDKDTVRFNYATVEWSATDSSASRHDGGHECGYGPWDRSTSVQMDCGFKC